MPRQRLGLTHTWATTVGQKLMIVPAAALLYCGGVVLALGAGASPSDVDSVTGYRTVHDQLGALDPSAWSNSVVIAIAVAGVLGGALLAMLGWAQRVIPHVTRSAIVLRDEADGVTTVSPRAAERIVEMAARHDGVRAAKATLGEGDVHLVLNARRPELIPDVLEQTRARSTSALTRAGLTDLTAVRVTITRFTRPSKKELLR